VSFKIYSTTQELTEADAPITGDDARDVQVILQDDENTGPYFQSGDDYYVWRDGRWVGVDHFGLFDYLLDTGLVLFGRTTTNAEYQAIYHRAKAEKQTWQPRERKPSEM
jgi:hypothetical protein